MNVVAAMEQSFLSQFREFADELSSEFPDYTLRVWSSSTGGATEHQGHDLGVECLFPDAGELESNCVAVYVGVKHLTTDPTFCDARVGWGPGQAPDVRCELIDDPIPATTDALKEVEQSLPLLFATFRQAISAWSVRCNGA
jgi:hypothetical protein